MLGKLSHNMLIIILQLQDHQPQGGAQHCLCTLPVSVIAGLPTLPNYHLKASTFCGFSSFLPISVSTDNFAFDVENSTDNFASEVAMEEESPFLPKASSFTGLLDLIASHLVDRRLNLIDTLLTSHFHYLECLTQLAALSFLSCCFLL